MADARPPSPATDIDAMIEIVALFEAARESDSRLADAELDEMLRHVPGKRAVLSGTWQDRPVVFRIFLTPDSPAPERDWTEMHRVWPQMQSEHLRIAQPLYLVKDHGILIMEHVSGTPLMKLLWNSELEDRARWLRPAADWLRAYTHGSEEEIPGRAQIWLERAEAAAATQPHGKLQRREARVLKQLRRLAPLCTTPWRHAICHGDFHPNNLIADGECLTGIDTGGSASMPVYKDIARFLMHMGRRGLIPSGKACFGVDAQGIDAFAEAFALSPQDRDVTLPFMLGCEALLRVEHKGMKRGRIRRAAKMTEALAADLAKL